MCDICKAELGMDSRIMLLDDIIDDDEPLKLCPVCKTSYIGMDEDMCENCLSNYKRASGEMDEDNDDWRTYLDDEDTKDTEEDDVIPLEEMEEDDDFQDDFEDEENMEMELDDYPDDLTDDFDDLDDYDDEDEEDDEDEDDDF